MRRLRSCIAVLAVCAIAGCATTGSSDGYRQTSRSSYHDDIDYQKMAIITEDALSRGYRIVWIHPPQKPKGKRGRD